MLTVTRPIEQAIMEVPGVRRVRSRRSAAPTEISAQFDPTTDMVVALQQAQGNVAEIRGELPRIPELVGRAADAGGISLLHRQPAGRLPRQSSTTTPSTSCVRRSRVFPASGNVEVLSSDTREIEVIVDPGAS